MTTRNSTVDIAKGLGILLVVFGHNWIVSHEQGELFRVIFSFHMPLFFFLSGVFLKESDSVERFLTTRADSLLKPFFVTLATLGALKLLIAITNGKATEPNFDYILGMIWATGPTIAWVPLWFLPHLFLALGFALILVKTINFGAEKLLLALFLLTINLSVGIFFIDAFWYPNPNNSTVIGFDNLPGLPWSIDLVLVTSSFICFGYLFRNWVKGMTFNSLGLLISISCFIWLHFEFDETIDFNSRIYGNYLISTLQAVVGIYITICLASYLQKSPMFRNALAYIGEGSLFILIFHGVLQAKCFSMLASMDTNLYVSGAVSFLLAISISLVFREITTRSRLLSVLLLPMSGRKHRAEITAVG